MYFRTFDSENPNTIVEIKKLKIMKKIKFLFPLIVFCFIIKNSLFAEDNEKVLHKVISTFTTMSSRGFHTEYFGLYSLKGETKFEGDIKIRWTIKNNLLYDALRISGTYHLKDVLGKRDEKADIYLIEKEFWNINIDAQEYFYSPDIKASLNTAFIRSPLFVIDVLRLMKDNKNAIQVTELTNYLQLICRLEKETFNLFVNKHDYSIQKILWKKDNWGKGEIIANIKFSDTKMKGQFDPPNVKQLKKKLIPTIGYIAPNWESKYHTGEPVNLKEFKGKVVVMDFWGTWCSPCLRAIPSLQSFHKKYGNEGVKIFGINYRDKGKPAKVMKKFNASYPTIDGEKIGVNYGILNWPTTVIVDKKGIIRELIVGYHGEKTDIQIDKILSSLIKED